MRKGKWLFTRTGHRCRQMQLLVNRFKWGCWQLEPGRAKPGTPLLSDRQFPFIRPMPKVHRAGSVKVTPKLLEKKKRGRGLFSSLRVQECQCFFQNYSESPRVKGNRDLGEMGERRSSHNGQEMRRTYWKGWKDGRRASLSTSASAPSFEWGPQKNSELSKPWAPLLYKLLPHGLF